jgi:hypothetical protein
MPVGALQGMTIEGNKKTQRLASVHSEMQAGNIQRRAVMSFHSASFERIS